MQHDLCLKNYMKMRDKVLVMESREKVAITGCIITFITAIKSTWENLIDHTAFQ